MSMRSSFVYGMGFEVADLSLVNAARFLKNHIGTLREIMDYRKDDVEAFDALDIEAAIEDIENEQGDAYKVLCDLEFKESDFEEVLLRDLVTIVIGHETGLSMCFEKGQECDECIGRASILLPTMQPWEMSERDRSLTGTDSLNSILEPYLKELGDEVNQEVEPLEVEYYG